VINEAFAMSFFANRSAIGLHIRAIPETVEGNKLTTYQVVGIARNARTNGLRGKIEPRFYIPMTQPLSDNVKRATFLIRTAREDTAVLGSVRQAFARVDPSLPLGSTRSILEQMAPWTASNRATAQAAAVFGCVALALSAIGLYGVLSFGIARRNSEIAVRIALGARPGRVIGMLLCETAVLVLAGLLLGAGLTYAALRFVTSELFGVAPQDPLTLSLATALLLLVALGAVYLPARKASHVEPMAALRQE
jgi:hypothetical protein